MSPKSGAYIIIGIILLAVAGLFVGNTFTYLDAHEMMVIQSPGGGLECHTDPGPYWNLFSKVTKYPRRKSYDFEDDASSKLIRFNDGGHANIYGSVGWEMPLDCQSIIKIQKTFGGPEGVDQNIVSKMIDTAIYNTGPLMSSKESATERRTELLQDISDQAINGVYLTSVKQVQSTDPITGQPKTINMVEVSKDDKGIIQRQQQSTIGEFNIKLLPLAIKNIKYDDQVEAQIKKQQELQMAVQTSIADAKKAEQDAITAQKQGEALVAQTKAKQDATNAVFVSDADKDLKVQTLATQRAALYKQQQILEGEGESEKRRLLMAANGALDQKLAAWLESQKIWADAFKGHDGPMVPSIVFGGGTQNAGDNMQNFMSMMNAKAARELALDMSQEAGKTAKK